MSGKTNELAVTSHVARDLLASAQLFRDEKTVVWEYVVNSLQYVDTGVAPRVQVIVQPRKKVIEIHDNGRGMDAEGLAHYFQMHGENLERKKGRPGRGKFGTGKAAAFGIARQLRVDTRRNGLRNVVELTRDAIDGSDGSSIPTDWVTRNEATEGPNGTVVTISDIVLPRLDVPSIVSYIERHLQAFRASEPEVAVNNHICRYVEPDLDGEPRAFRPSPSMREVLGDVELVLKVSRTPLSESEMGVVVSAGEGNVVALETGGADRKEMGNYILGHVDVPKLDEEVDGLVAFDSTRSLSLNPQHPVASQLLAFIGAKIEEIRRELVARAREARKSDEARRLSQEAQRIADILNRDFEEFRKQLREIRAASSSQGAVSSTFGGSGAGGDEEDDWIEGESTPGRVENTGKSRTGSGSGRPSPEIPSAGGPEPDGPDTVDPVSGKGRKPRPRGGFSVEYQHVGPGQPRSVFDRNTLTIVINKDHPVVAAALRNGEPEDIAFRRLSYEIAFSEYAIGLQYGMLERDPDIPADEVLYDVRTTLDRVARSAASLYA